MNNRSKSPEDARAFVEAVASRKGWLLNRDTTFLDQLTLGLATNYNNYGYYLCPCRDGDGDRETDKDIICPCDFVSEDHIEHGHCFCGLYLTESFAGLGIPPKPIPERRAGGI